MELALLSFSRFSIGYVRIEFAYIDLRTYKVRRAPQQLQKEASEVLVPANGNE